MSEELKKPAIWPDDLRIINNVETLRVVADALRLRILALLRREPATAKQLSGELGVPLKKLYYHLSLLEEHNLIHVRSTRIVSGIVEKQYQASAYRITVDRGLLTQGMSEPAGTSSMEVFLSFVLDHAHAEIQKSIAAGLIPPGGGISLGRLWMRLTPEQRDVFDHRLKQLYTEFAEQQVAPGAPDAHYYEILMGIYPVLAPPNQEEEDQQ